MELPSTDVCHVCLTGNSVSDDRKLIDALSARYVVTHLSRLESLLETRLLDDMTVLVLDGTGVGHPILDCLREIVARYAHLQVILVDGRLTQRQVADAFQIGARDYFAEPYDTDLLIERIDGLCRIRLASSRENEGGSGRRHRLPECSESKATFHMIGDHGGRVLT